MLLRAAAIIDVGVEGKVSVMGVLVGVGVRCAMCQELEAMVDQKKLETAKHGENQCNIYVCCCQLGCYLVSLSKLVLSIHYLYFP